MAERPVAIVTGTSRDVGKYAAFGLAQAGYDILGVYRNPQHDADQVAVIQEVRNSKARMVAVRADLLDKGTPDLIAERLNEDFGGRANVFIDNAAGGYGLTIAEARAINVDAPQRLVDRLWGSLAPDAVIVYNTSVPAHLFHTLRDSERELLGDYLPVAQTKNERERMLRSEFSRGGQRLAVVVGNGLDGSFVTRLLKGKNKAFVSQMLDVSEEGYFPTVMDMAAADVRVIRGNYPTGHTEYVGIAPQYQLYPLRPLGLSLVRAPEMNEGSILSREEIYGIIPHRWPFMFIGGVSEIEFGKRAVGSLVDLTHPDINWREGHFPNHPVVPGVILHEALQQLGALVVLGIPENRGKIAMVTGISEAKFRIPIIPGEEIILEASGMDRDLREMRGNTFGKGHVRALNAMGRLAEEGDISFALVDPEKVS